MSRKRIVKTSRGLKYQHHIGGLVMGNGKSYDPFNEAITIVRAQRIGTTRRHTPGNLLYDVYSLLTDLPPVFRKIIATRFDSSLPTFYRLMTKDKSKPSFSAIEQETIANALEEVIVYFLGVSGKIMDDNLLSAKTRP